MTIQSILHECGGDPLIRIVGWKLEEYSPRMWRWSWLSKLTVFSTYVEVIPNAVHEVEFLGGILHVCGGDPNR